MREIKFRAKRIDTGKWVYGRYFKTPLTDENSGTKLESGWFFLTGEIRHCIESDNVAFVIDPKTLGEYIGLKDKNGKEMYEGDIVNHGDNYPSEIVFDDYGWKLREWGYEDEGYKYRQHDLISYTSPIVVIGSIYENPDLLEH